MPLTLNANFQKKSATKILTIAIPKCQISKKNATKILTVAIPKCQISKKETPPNFVRKVIFCSFCKGLFEKTSHQKF